jgi:hypothetical protein
MPLTSAQLVRQRVMDVPRLYDSAFAGDGLSTRFTLPENFVSGTAYVPGNNGWSATGATFNSSGYVEFAGVMSANSAWRAVGVYTFFSDAVIDEYLSAEGSVAGAALQVCHNLLFDASKRARWMSPDGSQYDDVGSITALGMIVSALTNELKQDAIGAGSMESWAVNQGGW